MTVYPSRSFPFDMKSNIPNPTLKDIITNMNRTGNVNGTQFNKGHAFDMKSNIPDPALGICPITIAELGADRSSFSFTYDALTKYFMVVS